MLVDDADRFRPVAAGLILKPEHTQRHAGKVAEPVVLHHHQLQRPAAQVRHHAVRFGNAAQHAERGIARFFLA